MEYETILQALAVVAIGIVAFLGLMNFYNTSYTDDVGTSFNTTLNSVQVITNVTSLGSNVGNNTQSIQGGSATDANTDLVQRSLRVITALPVLLGLVPDLFYEAAQIIGIPETYINLGAAVFIFGFALLTAYLLLLGVKRLVQ